MDNSAKEERSKKVER